MIQQLVLAMSTVISVQPSKSDTVLRELLLADDICEWEEG